MYHFPNIPIFHNFGGFVGVWGRRDKICSSSRQRVRVLCEYAIWPKLVVSNHIFPPNIEI